MEKSRFLNRYYFSTWITAVILLFFYVFSINTSFLYTSILNYKNIVADPFDGTVNPIKYTLNYLTISSSDRAKKFSDLDSSKFIELPKYDASVLGRDITNLKAGNPDYEQTLALRVVYLTPYMGNYNHDGKEYVGSHLAVDIKAPIGTPIYSIANGVVTKVGYEKGGFGNYVIIRHDNVPLVDGTTGTIYSTYAHMDTITIGEGVKISKGEPLGTVGETGLAVGSHLHFQIDLDTAPFHAYWPFTGAEQRRAGMDFFSAISSGLGKEKALLYTINPMEFVNNNYNSSNTYVETQENNEFDNLTNSNSGNISLVKSEKQVAVLDNVSVTPITQVSEISTGNILATTEKTQVQDNLELINTETTNTGKIVDNNDINLGDNIDSILSLVGLNSASESTNTLNEDSKNYIYNDVADDYKYYNSIAYFKNLGSINGFEDGGFKPDNDITRIESLKIILNSFAQNPSSFTGKIFDDIDENAWENNYAQKGIELNIVDPKNTSFFGARTLNRVEALKLIILLKKVNIEDYKQKDYEINDVSKSDWFYPYVVYAIENNLFSVQNGDFVPSQAMTRGELVDTMYKVINLK